MLSRLFKKNENQVAKGSFEKLNKNELKNVIGGSGTDTTTTTTGGGTTGGGIVDAAKVKSHSNQNNN